MTATIKLGQLAEFLGATLSGSPEKEITGLATLQEAGPAQLSFLANPQYRKYLVDSQAAAVLLKAADAEGFTGDALVVADPRVRARRLPPHDAADGGIALPADPGGVAGHVPQGLEKRYQEIKADV